MLNTSEVMKHRKPEYDVDPIFPRRWSPHAMSGEDISEEELMTLFEAARWAPSSNNNQSWRFLYARRNTPNWATFFDLLSTRNQIWAKNAAVLIVIVSKNTFDLNGKPSRTHSFDTGAAWENLALQGSIKGLVVHGMQGFDYDKAREMLNIPEEYTVEAMAAVGKPGNREDLPEDMREWEYPNNRKKVREFTFEGSFRES